MKIQPDWIEWKGGECPVDEEDFIVYELRTGRRGISEAWRFSWRHFSGNSDIVAYAPIALDIEPYKPQPKWTVRKGFSHAYLVYKGREKCYISPESSAIAIADALNAAGVEL